MDLSARAIHRAVISLLFAMTLALYATPLRAQTTVAAPAACTDGAQSSGATYRICMPAGWNNKLIVYAHGYIAPNRPIGIPEDQMTLPGTSTTVDQLVTAQGYAFATSGYSTNGLAVLQGIADLVDVVTIFASQQSTPTQVLLVGVSEGGLITTLAVERHPEVFDGGLALCSPSGSFRGQTDYFGDFRVAFDYFFPGLLPPTPVDVPADLLNTWETSYYSTTVRPALLDPANGAKVDQLLAVTGAAYNSVVTATKESTVEQVLWYNIFATNDARDKLGGQPFDNTTRSYSGSSDDAALNAQIGRFAADAAAVATMSVDYETTGRLIRPLITMHTTGDPVVPYTQAEAYRTKIVAADNLVLHRLITITAYGHCAFGTFDILNAFNQLVRMADTLPPRAYLPVVVADQPSLVQSAKP
jgi:pimeloyl-ACP methyl ester carboxylesterase